jgi:hypothetical protein
MEADTIGLVVLVAASAARFIAAKLSRCRKCRPDWPGCQDFIFSMWKAS